MKYIINECRDPYFNMAFDEYCLQSVASDEPFFFLWQNSPTVVIGVNQNPYKEVDLDYLEREGINLVRRITGGGAVFHDDGNVNFTFIGSYTNDREVFEHYIGYIVEALKKMGINGVAMSGRNDILVNGKKISGCAKRVFRDRCMVHGTLLYDVDTEVLKKVLDGPKSKLRLKGTSSVKGQIANIKTLLPNIADVEQFKEVLTEILSGNSEQIVISDEVLAKVRQNGIDKYASKSWVYGKLAESNICYEQKFACGMVEVEMVVNNRVIESVRFNGDFLGNEKIEELELLIKGQKYSHSHLVALFEVSAVANYLDKITAQKLANLLMGVEE